jgi:hypothetical protein
LYKLALSPPYRGVVAVVGGMTWARAGIFYGSDVIKSGNPTWNVLLPPLLSSTLVQIVNMPIIRASITLQNPDYGPLSTSGALKKIYAEEGVRGLWHGTSAGILKTVPKYCTAVIVKDVIATYYPAPESETSLERYARLGTKAVVAAVCGAVLTNPADVVRNEMFKNRGSGLVETVKALNEKHGFKKWSMRGVDKNLVSVAVPVGITIFFIDIFTALMKPES